ncbi:MAG: hypothetical protein JWR42_2062 [Marmoricola sp.]|nr:hypothetical protein [Marmoricola sp.]
MTTTARPAEGQPRGTTHRVLLGAGAATAATVGVLALAGALIAGSAAGGGALVGGGLSLALLFTGALLVASATTVSPQTSLLVAMTTFLMVVVAAAAGFYLLEATGFVGQTVSPRWVAGGVAVTGASWSLAHLVGHARSRILAFDLPTGATADSGHGSPGADGAPGGQFPVDAGAGSGATKVRVP